jgi:chromosome segregation ATPase
MTTTDTSKEKQDREIDESIQSRTETVQQTIIPKIKKLETLKQGVYAFDLEKTISDMFMVMKNMEVQLEKVLRINSVLEKDLNEAKEMIAGLKEAKWQLEQTISHMEMEAPSKRELQIEIDQLIEERNDVQTRIRQMGSKIEKLQGVVIDYQKRSGDLEEEKRDFMSEITFLESKLNTATEKTAEYKNAINLLQGEKLAHMEKSKFLEEELNEALDDKYKLMSELKDSRKAVAKLHAALSDKRLQAKKSFYESAGE